MSPEIRQAKPKDTMPPKPASNVQGGSELHQTLWLFRREFFAVGVLSAVANVLMLTPTLYMMQLFDRVMVSQNATSLLAISFITLALFLLLLLAESARSRVLVGVSVRFDERLSQRVFQASFAAQLMQRARVADGGTGRSFNDLLSLRQFVTGQGVFAFFDAPWIPIYIGVCWLLHPVLGITAIIFAMIQGLIAWLGHTRSVQPAEQSQTAHHTASAYLHGKLRHAEVLESMGMLGALKARWHDYHQRFISSDTQSSDLGFRISALSKWVRYVQQSASLAVGAILAIQGEISAGAMIAANILVARALAPIDMLVSTWRPFLVACQSWQRLSQLLDSHPPQRDQGHRACPEGHLTLRNICVTLPGRTQPALEGVDIDIAPGQIWVLLGPSGAGKSTLGRVMLGILPNAKGEVLLDGRPLHDWSRRELGPHVGYLPQDVELFDGTVADNISRGAPPDPELVVMAAKACGLHELILRLPKGYDTPIGDGGTVLSGGMRQRIALARALYGSPRLVVLDEPNANLDDAGEQALARTLIQLREQQVAVVLITHRPGVIGLADHLLVLQQGRIRFKGPREVVLTQLRAAAHPPQVRDESLS